MTVSGALARPMMAGIFIYGGMDALRDPESKAKAADDVAPMIAEALHLPMTDTVTLVRINGGVQVVAGTLLALGQARRVSALVLAASLVPTTYAGHRFWEEPDDERRAHQRIQFLKNAAMLGGLVLAAGDTGGRPSLPWQAKRAARQALEGAAAAGTVTQAAARNVLDVTRQAPASAVAELSRRARKSARKAAYKARQAELAEWAEQAQQLARTVKESDLTKRAIKTAKKTAKKAVKADFSRRAVKAARKAARKAAKKADQAELTKRASRAARIAAQNVHKAQLGPHASAAATAAATRLHHVTGEAVDRAREAVGDGALGRVRDAATTAAHQVAERAKDALPVAS